MCCNFQIKDQNFPDPSEKFPTKIDYDDAVLTQDEIFLKKITPYYDALKGALPKTWRWRIKRVGWFESHFSKWLGMNEDAISVYVRNKRTPPLKKLARIEYQIRLFEIDKGFKRPDKIMDILSI